MSVSSVRLEALRFIAHKALPPLFDRAVDGRLRRFARALELLSISPHHKAQFRYLTKLIDDQHPSLQLIHRLRQLHPNVRRSFINALCVNATLLGEIQRKDFRRAHGTSLPPYLIVISPVQFGLTKLALVRRHD